MNAPAVAWALRQDVRCAPTKLMLVALAAKSERGVPTLMTREVFTDLARVASIRRGGIWHRLIDLETRGHIKISKCRQQVTLNEGRG
jgi:hypothetical protein